MTITLLNYADVYGAMQNIVAIEKEITLAVNQITGRTEIGDALPFMRYEAEGVYPKWLNELFTDKPEEFGIWENLEPVVIRTELQLGHRTEGVDGALEQTLYIWIPYTQAMARTRPRLISDARPTVPNGLLAADLTLSKPRMPGDIIACEFLWTLAFSVTNPERDS